MTPAAIAVLCFAAAVLSALLVAVSIRYAHRRALFDAPGARRSHSVPTPRGGGIGIVFAILLCAFVPLLRESPVLVGTVALSFAAVAMIGWIDDHRPLSARLRFAVHIAAALATVLAAMSVGLVAGDVAGALLAIGAVVAIAWSINLHNFMDGIDGILALQAAFVFFALAAFAYDGRQLDVMLLAGVGLAATLAFLPFNLVRAQVFMGDVGSGALGFLLGALLLFAVSRGALSPASAALLVSAFVVDATMTLASRMLRGKRWYRPHREHLYQWLHRSGRSHLEVDVVFVVWNFVLVLPLVAMIEAGASRYARVYAAGAYLLAVALWWLGKRASLMRVRRSREQPGIT